MEQIRVKPKGGSKDHHELNLGLYNLLLQPHHCFLLKKRYKGSTYLITALADIHCSEKDIKVQHI
jgi:hypothetical protein